MINTGKIPINKIVEIILLELKYKDLKIEERSLISNYMLDILTIDYSAKKPF